MAIEMATGLPTVILSAAKDHSGRSQSLRPISCRPLPVDPAPLSLKQLRDRPYHDLKLRRKRIDQIEVTDTGQADQGHFVAARYGSIAVAFGQNVWHVVVE